MYEVYQYLTLFFLSRLIENDANIQEEVSKMPPLIDKLLFMTDGNRLSGYSTSANQLASITLLYCTYNVKSAKPLVDCGALEKMVNITRNFDKDSDTLLRYEDILQNVRYLPFNLKGELKSMQSLSEALQSLCLRVCWPNYTIILIQLCHTNLFIYYLCQKSRAIL